MYALCGTSSPDTTSRALSAKGTGLAKAGVYGLAEMELDEAIRGDRSSSLALGRSASGLLCS